MDDSTVLLENPRRRRRRKTTSRRRKTTSRRRRRPAARRRRRRSTTTVVVKANPRRRRRPRAKARRNPTRRRRRASSGGRMSLRGMFGDLTGAVKFAAWGFAGEAVAQIVWSKTPLGRVIEPLAPQITSRPGVPQLTLSLLLPVAARMLGFRQNRMLREIVRANLIFGAWAATAPERKKLGTMLKIGGLSDYETVDLYGLGYDEGAVPAQMLGEGDSYDDAAVLLDYETVDPFDAPPMLEGY